MRWRASSWSQSTWWPSNSGPSTQTKWVWPPTSTRQAPHMPVPSTMIELRLTMVCTPNGFVVRAQNFIMIAGPMAQTRSIACPRFEHLLQRVGDQRLAPVGAVVGADDQLVADGAHLVFPEKQVLVAGADDRDDRVAGLLQARGRWGRWGRCPRRRPRTAPCHTSRSRWAGPGDRSRWRNSRRAASCPSASSSCPLPGRRG